MSKTARIVQLEQEASRHRALIEEEDWAGRVSEHILATSKERQADLLRQPEQPLAITLGEVTSVESSTPAAHPAWRIADMLAGNPDMLGIDASHERLALLEATDVLELGIDASFSAGAANSLEKMLCHQLAMAHKASMALAGKALDSLDHAPPTQTARLLGTSTRLMNTFQSGLLTLQRLKTGGQQQITVTHQTQNVLVQEGGQAVVASASPVKRGPKRGKRGQK